MSVGANEEVRFGLDFKVGASKVPKTGKAGQFRVRAQLVLYALGLFNFCQRSSHNIISRCWNLEVCCDGRRGYLPCQSAHLHSIYVVWVQYPLQYSLIFALCF